VKMDALHRASIFVPKIARLATVVLETYACILCMSRVLDNLLYLVSTSTIKPLEKCCRKDANVATVQQFYESSGSGKLRTKLVFNFGNARCIER
jgi:hypothetical protein